MLSFGFPIFCWYRGFCHRTGSDLLLFLELVLSLIVRRLSLYFMRLQNGIKHSELGTSYCLIRSPFRFNHKTSSMTI